MRININHHIRKIYTHNIFRCELLFEFWMSKEFSFTNKFFNLSFSYIFCYIER